MNCNSKLTTVLETSQLDVCDDAPGVLVFITMLFYVLGFFLGMLRYWVIQNSRMQSGHTSIKENALAGIG